MCVFGKNENMNKPGISVYTNIITGLKLQTLKFENLPDNLLVFVQRSKDTAKMPHSG